MTKSVKHKKARKDDFKKLKLKLGRKLKKAQNETKTDFKARKIIIKEQLSVKNQSSLITKKQLNIKELVSRLNHHSAYVRQDGVNGLKEIIASNVTSDLVPHLSSLIQGLAPCMLDTDRLIRSSAVKVLEAIIIKVENLIQPYFTLLTSHLSCAMVHLNTGVQSDSLLLMDVLLTHTPSLIAEKSNILLQNYLSLISRKMDKPNTVGEKKPTFSHTLISNPNSQLATQKFRINMLINFCKYLTAILGEKKKLEESSPLNSWQVIQIGCMPSLMKEGGTRASVQKIKILTDENEAKSFITLLVPLLFQIWAEVHVNQKHISEGNLLDTDAVQLLTSISQIILLLWNITKMVTLQNPSDCPWFVQLLKGKLESEILDGFPYGNHECAKTKEKINKIEAFRDCQNLNVILATLTFLYMKKNHKRDVKVISFYCDLLSENSSYISFNLEDVVNTATQLIEDRRTIPIKLRDELLEASLRCYQSTSYKSKGCLLKMPLAASSQDCQMLWRTYKLTALRKWMIFLVNEALVCPDPGPILEVLLQFRLRNTPGFAEIMSAKKDKFKEKMNSSDNQGIEVIV